ncbi:MAG: tRNA-dihydrouridine synthase, partial [Bifidobacteriaceae bacterium]|nr:tRNA-dihydrouridine synthase [Bifidobacteriaceae bacterium]
MTGSQPFQVGGSPPATGPSSGAAPPDTGFLVADAANPSRAASPPAALPGPLRIGALTLATPVMLAPMAGVTNLPFRVLARSFGDGLFVAEMVTSRALVEGNAKTVRMLRHDPSEQPRSIQLYGVDPAWMAAAVQQVAERDLADHIDLNFGCPAPKVTKQGGGAALPWKLDHFRQIVAAAVSAAGQIPVTVKLRAGIDADHLTFMEAGLAAETEGAAAVTLHARTLAEHYSGCANWDYITQL